MCRCNERYGVEFEMTRARFDEPLMQRRHCCAEVRVICTDPFEVPVRMRISGRFAEIGLDKTFRLFFSPNCFQSTNTAPVYLVDGEREFPLIEAMTGNIVRYDQMIERADYEVRRRGRNCRDICLECFLGSDGPFTDAIHVVVRSPLPKTTFVPTPDLAGPSEGIEA